MITCMAISTSALSQTSDMQQLLSPAVSKKIVPVTRPMSREERDSELSVRTRRAAAYDPHYIQMGEWTLAPSVETFTRYMDNVYATDNNKQEDFVYGVRPEVVLRSNFLTHQLNANFYVEDGNYNKIKEEDYTDYGADVSARYDVYPGMAIPLVLGYSQNHSRRDEPEDRTSIDPAVYKVTKGQTGVRLTGDFLEINARAGFQNVTYEDTTSFAGTPVDNSSRARTIYTNNVKVGFPQEAMIAPYVYGTVQSTRYDRDRDIFNISRDSRDVEGGVGSYFNFTDVLRSSLETGYVRREFDDSSLDPVGALTCSVNLNWDATTLASFALTGDRSIRETATSSSSQIQTTIGLGMIYELAPNIILKPAIGYLQRDYQQSDNKIKAYTADMEGLYKINPNIWASLKYRGISQDEDNSSAGNGSYDGNTITLSLKFQL